MNFTSGSALSGFIVGCCSPVLVGASVWIVEAHMAVPLPYVRGLSFALAYYFFMGLILGFAWAVLFAVALPLVRRILHSKTQPWPTLGYVTLAAIAAQAMTIFAADIAITSLHLQPPTNNTVGPRLGNGVELALYVLPPLAAAVLVVARRSKV